MKVKTCVYAIALNEIKFVNRFMEHCKGADLVLVCDTGSTDGTPQRLRELGATVYDIVQTPWRFDVPRNTALSLIPSDIDICLSIDLDEFLQPGWVEAIDKHWQESKGSIHRISYDYIWNWTSDGKPDIRFFADKIHHRHNYLWRHPCHETLYYVGEGEETKVCIPEVILEHHADSTKSRGQYLSLLKMAVDEDPNNDRMAHYYARELFFKAKYLEAIEEFKRHLELPRATWNEERAASMRYIARCYKNIDQFEEAHIWALKSTMECPSTRETWLELARCAYARQDWPTCYWASTTCLKIETRTLSYISENLSWGSEPYDYAAISSFNLGIKEQAIKYGQQAFDLSPDDQRLRQNLEFYLSQQ